MTNKTLPLPPSYASAAAVLLAAMTAASAARAQTPPRDSPDPGRVVLPPVRIAPIELRSSQPERTSPGTHDAFVALRWSTTAATVAFGAVGAVFAVMAANDRAALSALATTTDPRSGLPLATYSDVQSIDAQRAMHDALGTSLLCLAGASAVTSIVLWAISGGSQRTRPHPMPASVAFGVSGVVVSASF